MTKKRFTIKDSILNEGYVIIDNEKEYSFPVLDSTLNHMFCKALNKLHEENNKLRLQLNLCSDQRSEFHRGARENANRVGRLEKENEQLKASLYAEKTNTAEVINNYAKQFKRYSKEFSFMIDLAEDLGVDVSKLEALDD